MFMTDDFNEVPVPRALMPEGARAWRLVRMNLCMPWFFIECTDCDPEGSSTVRFQLSGAADFEQFLEGIVESFQIVNVYLVTPPWLNKGPVWKMEALREVVLAEHPIDQSQIELYFFTSGKRLVICDINVEEKCLVNKRQIYPLRTLQ